MKGNIVKSILVEDFIESTRDGYQKIQLFDGKRILYTGEVMGEGISFYGKSLILRWWVEAGILCFYIAPKEVSAHDEVFQRQYRGVPPGTDPL